MLMRPKFSLFLFLIVALPSISLAQTVLQPGETKDDFVFGSAIQGITAIQYVRCGIFSTDFSCVETVENGGTNTGSWIGLAGPPPGQKLRANLLSALPAPFNHRREAVSNGLTFTDFCVASQATGDCSFPDGETITANIFYKVSWAGRVTTFGPFVSGQFKLLANITDLSSRQPVSTTVLQDETVGGGLSAVKIIKIAGVPIPIPLPVIDRVQIEEVRTFTVQIKRGQRYRFEVDALLFAKTPVANGGIVKMNFNDAVAGIGTSGLERDGGVFVDEFRVEVGSGSGSGGDLDDLNEQISMLQQSLNSLSTQIGSQGESFSAELTDVRQLSGGLQEQVTDLGIDLGNLNAEIAVLTTEDTLLQSDIADLSELAQKLLLDMADINTQLGDLSTGQTDLQSQIAAIENDVGILETQHNMLQEAFSSHTHEYLTGKGDGHNNTNVSTSPPK
jgi:hypothetical protein